MSEEWKDGLPPVGCECEYRPSGNAAWATVKVLAIAGDFVWCLYKNATEPYTNSGGEFRSIKTKEDIEREEAINRIAHDISRIFGIDHEDAEKLYDFGYRKYGEVVSVEQFLAEYQAGHRSIFECLEDCVITRKVK